MRARRAPGDGDEKVTMKVQIAVLREMLDCALRPEIEVEPEWLVTLANAIARTCEEHLEEAGPRYSSCGDRRGENVMKVHVGDSGRGTASRIERIESAATRAGFVVTCGSPRFIVERPAEQQAVLRMPWSGDLSGPPRLRAPHPTTGPYLQPFDPDSGEDLSAEAELSLDEQAWREGRGGAE